MRSMLFLAITLAAILAANSQGGPVLDINGDPGEGYYVLPIIRGDGGGLVLAGRGSERCPLDVVQASSEVDNGFPMKFSNWRSKVGFVPESEPLNIETIAITTCTQPTYWWLDHLDKERKLFFVTTGPKPSELDKKSSRRSLFRIEKSDEFSENVYKFSFCSRLCEDCIEPAICHDVRRFTDEKDIKRLAISGSAISNVPFNVVFVKSNENKGSTMIM